MHSGVTNLTDILDKANILRAKMAERGWSLKSEHVERTLEELARHEERDNVLTLGSCGFVDPRIEELASSISQKPKKEHLHAEPVSAEEDRDSTANLVRKFHDDTIREIIAKEFSSIEEKALYEFRQRFEKRWSEEKAKLIEVIELASGNFCFRPSPINSDKLIASYPSILSRSAGLDEEEIQFARRVHEYVTAKRLMKNGMEELQKFCIPTTKDSEVWELWRIINCIVFESEEIPINSTEWFIGSCLKFLQLEFREFLKKQVLSNLVEAELGGVPGVYSLVRGYLSVNPRSYYEGPTVEGKPAWQFVYLCLRCGDAKAALRASIMAHLPTAWIQKLEGVTTSSDLLKAQYKQQEPTGDPYQLICYCLVEPDCDPNNPHQEIADSIEDFLWLKLYQANTGSEERFKHLQLQIREEFGEKYFINSSDEGVGSPLLYAQCLLLTGQFEHVVELLCRYPQKHYFVHAIHMGIVFYESGLIEATENLDDPLLTGNRLNVHKLIKVYAEKRFASAEESDELTALLDYFFLLKSFRLKNEGTLNGFYNALAQLAQLTESQFDKLFGFCRDAKSILPDKRYQGLIDDYTDDPTDLLSFVADCMEARAGQTPTLKSSTLRFLAGKYETAADNACELISAFRLLCIDNSQESEIEAAEVMNFAERILNIIGDQHENLLLTYQTAKFFQLFHARNYRQALDLLRNLDLLPLNSDKVNECVLRFENLPDTIKFSISDVLEAAVVCLQKIYSGGIPSQEDYPTARSLREQTDALIRYTGTIPFHIRSSVSSRLLQLCSSCSV